MTTEHIEELNDQQIMSKELILSENVLNVLQILLNLKKNTTTNPKKNYMN